MAGYVDENGKQRDLDAEQARFARAWWFRFRVGDPTDGEPTYIASAYRKIWPLHSATAVEVTENEARACLLDLLADGFDDRRQT